MAAAVEPRDACGLGRCWRAVVGVEQDPALQQDAGEPEQPVGDAAQGPAVGVTARPEGLVAAAALGVVQHGHPGPVEHGVAQSGLGGVAHDDEAGLAAALGHRRDAGQGPERGTVSATERPGGLGEQDGQGIVNLTDSKTIFGNFYTETGCGMLAKFQNKG
jgi:hypothetical protein